MARTYGVGQFSKSLKVSFAALLILMVPIRLALAQGGGGAGGATPVSIDDLSLTKQEVFQLRCLLSRKMQFSPTRKTFVPRQTLFRDSADDKPYRHAASAKMIPIQEHPRR
jgi:hypothetical protein